jgi:hypothetical protein
MDELNETIDFCSQNIIIPEKVSMEEFSKENEKIDINVNNEGIICKAIINNHWYLLKLQTISYQFARAQGPEPNIYKGYIYLYQTGKLKEYLNKKNIKLVNPLNSDEEFDFVGVIDCVFKVLTSELFVLFKLLWNMKTNKHQNGEFYKYLPKEYKDILFGMRGLYFQVRSSNMNNEVKHKFGLPDIYNYLKTIDIEHFCALLRQRKLMLNWVNKTDSPDDIKIFRKLSEHCDDKFKKLITIYVNKLYPDITSTDIPQIN